MSDFAYNPSHANENYKVSFMQEKVGYYMYWK